jgi:DNA-directed RNA polymerase subunit RPC12/RpoP
MPIKLDCPRCRKRLQVPSKLADGYVNCPRCKGRIWVSRDAKAESTPTAPLAAPPNEFKKGTPADFSSSAYENNHQKTLLDKPAEPSAPPPAPEQPKKVARFIAAEPADSALQLAADGKLPQLHLEETASRQTAKARPSSMSPLLLGGILTLSVALSIMLAAIGPPAPTASLVEQQAEKRLFIEHNYFGGGNLDNRPLEPYQLLLREAQRAFSRGDRKTQRDCYRRVLEMLRAERGEGRPGLTGSPSRDKDLEQAIAVLLGGG